MIMLCLGLRTALHLGRGDRALSEKIVPGVISGFPRKVIPPWLTPQEGRAPHAPKEGITPTRTRVLLATGLFAHPPAIMTCPGLRRAFLRTRRARPSEKTGLRVM
jgi:hypothetical protein